MTGRPAGGAFDYLCPSFRLGVCSELTLGRSGWLNMTKILLTKIKILAKGLSINCKKNCKFVTCRPTRFFKMSTKECKTLNQVKA